MWGARQWCKGSGLDADDLKLQFWKVLAVVRFIQGHQSIRLKESVGADDKVCKEAPGPIAGLLSARSGVPGEPLAGLRPRCVVEVEVDCNPGRIEERAHAFGGNQWMREQFGIDDGGDDERAGD
jgi:hypothetical protein